MSYQNKNKFTAVAVFIATILFASTTLAAKLPGGLSGAEIKTILPLLNKHGVVGLSETDSKGNPIAMTIAIKINAPRNVVFDIYKNPKNFYYLSTLFKENEVLDSHGGSMAWSWASRHKFMSFTGTNVLALYPPRRADVAIRNSTIGSGNFTLKFYEDKNKETILVISGFLDVQSSEWLIRFLVGGNPAMRQAMNIAIGLVVAKGTKSLAEKLAKGEEMSIHKTTGRAGGTPALLEKSEIERLTPLLKRGQIFLTDSHPAGRLQQATVLDIIDAPAAKILETVNIPQNYAKQINAISGIVVHKQEPKRIEFSWTLGFSIFGLTSRNILEPAQEGVLLSSIDGDLKGARWRWQIVPKEPSKTIVAYHSYAHVARTSSILKSTVRREPYLEHGLVMGSNIVMLKAMQRQVESPTHHP